MINHDPDIDHYRGLTTETPQRERIHFAALAPKEKGFFFGTEGSKIDRKAILELYTHLQSNDDKAIQSWFTLHTTISYPGKKTKENLLQAIFPSISLERLEYLQDDNYDYFEELKNQYKFYVSNAHSLNVSLYKHIEDHNQFSRQSDLSVVFTIEGIHSLGIANPEDETSVNGKSSRDISFGKLKSRIRQLKGEEDLDDIELKKWDHAPLLMRLASCFGNGIFGHAKSFKSCTDSVFDQRKCLDKGVIINVGYEVVRELLGLDELLQPTGSRRILIDMHRLSANSRKDLYQNIFRKFNRNINPEHPIPVVFTEAAYSGIDNLEEMIKNSRTGLESETFKVNGYTGLSLNLSDEDILEVFRSGGLISFTMEESRMGSDIGGLETIFMNTPRSRAIRLLGRQISAVVRIPFAYNLPNSSSIWDRLNIGNGLKGSGDQLERYKLDFKSKLLEEDLCESITRIRQDHPIWFEGFTTDQLVNKILRHNIEDFVMRNY